MGIVKFASVCDECGKRGPEYEAFRFCRECGRDLCPEHSNHDWDEDEKNSTLCRIGEGCQA